MPMSKDFEERLFPDGQKSKIISGHRSIFLMTGNIDNGNNLKASHH